MELGSEYYSAYSEADMKAMSRLQLRPFAFQYAHGRVSKNESEHLAWIRRQRMKCNTELGVRRCSEDEFDEFLIKNIKGDDCE